MHDVIEHSNSDMDRQSPEDGALASKSNCRKEEEGTDLEKDGEDDDEQQEGERLDIKKASRAKSKSKKPRLIF